MPKKRHFGNVRRRDSGRWQARYPGPDGRLRSAPATFARKAEAERFLSLIEAQMSRGDWIDPERAQVQLGPYADCWITERASLRPRTVELYRSLLRRHIAPGLGTVPLARLDTALVRRWRAELLARGVSPTTTAKAYRLLRAVLNTAADDRLISRNPCRIRGGDREQAAERPVLSAAEVLALADRVPTRFRAFILLTTFASLRFGEVTALERRDVDLDGGTVRVRRAFVEVQGHGLVAGPPKASRRSVAIPQPVVEVMRCHLAEFVGAAPSALVFTGPDGGPLRRGTVRKRLGWKEALAELGLEGITLHDLRHTGNTMAARSGVSTRDLMVRMGHDSMRAAVIYQHATATADARVVAALNAELSGADTPDGDSHAARPLT